MFDKEKRKAKHGETSFEVPPMGARFFMWVSIGFLAGTLALSPLAYYFYWSFNVAPAQPTIDPLFIPTARPTTVLATAVPEFWEGWEFLDGSQAVMLNRLPNVVNFAVIDRNGLLTLATDVSLVFTAAEPWQRAERPLSMETLTVTGTSVQLELSGLRRPVILNVLQPFVLSNNIYDLIFIVDITGQLWSIEADQAEWMSVYDAIGQLTEPVSPNPQMTINIENR